MLGAIIGDIVGSVYEHRNIKTKDFPLFAAGSRFTDDTVCTVAVADAMLTGGRFADALRAYVRRYPEAGYGGMFRDWGLSDDRPAYGSWGNGSAMRVSPVAYAGGTVEEVLALARRSAEATHDHPEGIRGAEAVALAVRLALDGRDRREIRRAVESRFGYDLSRSVEEIRPGYRFDISCAGTVPPALTCALEATGYEDALRNAVSIGGDSDTIACIAGGLAEALYGLPAPIAAQGRSYLDPALLAVVDRFAAAYGSRVTAGS